MCDFCENIKPLTKENKWNSALSMGVRYNENEKCFCLYTVGTEGDFDDDYLEVIYCPLCGRKLSEETEND